LILCAAGADNTAGAGNTGTRASTAVFSFGTKKRFVMPASMTTFLLNGSFVPVLVCWKTSQDCGPVVVPDCMPLPNAFS
jgi:hypothetical protein